MERSSAGSCSLEDLDPRTDDRKWMGFFFIPLVSLNKAYLNLYESEVCTGVRGGWLVDQLVSS